MARYLRHYAPGGCYFFTVALADRRSTALMDHADALRACVLNVQRAHPFRIDAAVVLPDHLHMLWTLPAGDAAFPLRWSLIKRGFSRGMPRGERSLSMIAKRERGIWQRRYWEHTIRDDDDFAQHVAYIHNNPVKHGYIQRAADWPVSSLHRYIRDGLLPPDWSSPAVELTRPES